MAPSATQLAKLAIGTADPVDTFLNWTDFDPGVSYDLFDANGTRGTFDKDGNRVTTNRILCTPRYSSYPTGIELAALCAWGMAGTPTGTNPTTYPLGDTPSLRNVYFAPKQGDTFYLGGVGVDVFTLAAAQGEALRCDIEAVGQTVDTAHAAFPSGLGPDQTSHPWVLANLVLTVAGTTRNTREFNYTVRHGIDRNRFLNSLNLTTVLKLDQMVTVAVDVPSGDVPGLWNAGAAGVTLSAVFTNAGGGVLTMTFSDIRFRPNSPVHPSKQEGFLRLEGECYRIASGRPVTLTLTPGT